MRDKHPELSARWFLLTLLFAVALSAQSCDGGGTSGTGVEVTVDSASSLEDGATPICGTAVNLEGDGRAEILIEAEATGEGAITDSSGRFILTTGFSESGELVLIVHDENGTPERIVMNRPHKDQQIVLLTAGGQIAVFDCEQE